MVLDLSDNQIQKRIPKWMQEFEDMLYLNLSANHLEEMESSQSTFSPALEFIDLHSNRLQGQILPILSSATFLDFSSNNFSLEIPSDTGSNLSFALYVSLARNNIHEVIPTSICNAPFLQVLNLSDNDLEGAIPECIMMESLRILNLRNSSLNGSIPSNIQAACRLKTLELNGNRLEGRVPESLQNCSKLEVLDIGNNMIRDKFPCQLKKISSLRDLVLWSNRFYWRIGCPNTAGTWEMLQIVDFSRNNFRGIIPAHCLTKWDAMKSSTKLSRLQYSYLELTGLYYQVAVKVTIKGLELELVKILSLFLSIDFSCNGFEGPISDTLGDLQALYILNMSHNALSGPIPFSIGNLQQLESLDISSNYLNGTIPDTLSNLNFLALLNLSYNQLIGKMGIHSSRLGVRSRGCGSYRTSNILGQRKDVLRLSRGQDPAGAGAPDRIRYRFWNTYDDDDDDKNSDLNNSRSDLKHTFEYSHEEHEAEEETWGRYCVLCTKFDPSMKRVPSVRATTLHRFRPLTLPIHHRHSR